MSILTSVALGFFGRKLLDVGGWVGGVAMTAIGIYTAATPAQQATINAILTGHWHSITLGALLPFIVWAWGQFMSFKATVKPQIVTSAGQKIDLEALQPVAAATVEATAVAAPRKRTLADLLAEKLSSH